MPQLIRNLKGGSLNSTALYQDHRGLFVRKLISTAADREYGYVRWYSQLKKLQRFNELIPGLVPKIYDAGFTDQGAYFDMEYIEADDIKTIFKQDQATEQTIEHINDRLWQAFDCLHQHKYPSMTSSLELYYQEEVFQKLQDARRFPEFEEFYQIDSYEYTSGRVQGLKSLAGDFAQLFREPVDEECYVHGNPTLENMLYSPDRGIVFIDLYEEGIVDSRFMDYSQVLQCCHSHYGMLNDGEISVSGNRADNSVYIPWSLGRFNQVFQNTLKSRTTAQQYRLVQLFEATQFFRMLPFKCHSGNITSAKYFYVHACSLVNRLL
jgi:hypothetical protein